MAEGESLQVPFNVVDEVVHVLDGDAEPRTIRLEVRTQGALDDGRPRAAGAAGGLGRVARETPGPGRRVSGRPVRHQQI